MEHSRNTFHAQAQSYSLPTQPSPYLMLWCITPGPPHAQTEQTMALSLSLLAASKTLALALSVELHGVPTVHSQKTHGHLLQGRTVQSVVAHVCLSHVKAPSVLNISGSKCA